MAGPATKTLLVVVVVLGEMVASSAVFVGVEKKARGTKSAPIRKNIGVPLLGAPRSHHQFAL